MKRIFILCSLLLLAACVNRSTTFTDAAGKQANCSVMGWGVAGSLVAIHHYNRCVETANKRGYK